MLEKVIIVVVVAVVICPLDCPGVKVVVVWSDHEQT